LIGVYAGVGLNTYLLNNLYPNSDLIQSLGGYQVMIGNDKDYLPTRTSYKLNLRGPSVAVQTACSTSLVAAHIACQSLKNGECDMALAGGVSVRVPQKRGYLFQEGMILSPDGHCRAFDARAQGTVGGNGVGIVALKRLEDAQRDGDTIYAVIRGSAINNDGALKAGYTAPAIDGQAAVITMALNTAGVESRSVQYIEAHGTGTQLGDPIEISALKQAFRAGTRKNGFCALGSVKTNFGHLDAAAGVAGLIKIALALHHREIPPSLYFEKPNPQIDFADSPFFVNTQLTAWSAGDTPRRAGVSSFGIGGTNAHAVLEEAPVIESSHSSRSYQLLLLSAKTASALETLTANLADYFAQNPNIDCADAAYTLAQGRRVFPRRRMLVCRSLEDAIHGLREPNREPVLTVSQDAAERPVVFMFSGQGSQYVNMASELYPLEPMFREWMDYGAELLRPELNLDLREVIDPDQDRMTEAEERLRQTEITQPALFILEYALAQLWMSWGVRPQAMIGHSIGEIVAACLAGVFSLPDALKLTAERGRLMGKMPAGSMLAVPLSESELPISLNGQLSLAAVNGPGLCVISGPIDEVEAARNQLATEGVECRFLRTSHAFHSEMMEPIVSPFSEMVAQVERKPPRIPLISNVTGQWITAEEAADPAYWGRHLRNTVRFSEGISTLLDEPQRIFLEVGPGNSLCTLALRHSRAANPVTAFSSIRHPQDHRSDEAFLLTTLGKLWLAGVNPDWSGFYNHERRRRIPLPTYPFERQRYWIDPPDRLSEKKQRTVESHPRKNSDIADWFYIPSWKRSFALSSSENSLAGCWLFFADGSEERNWIACLAERLQQDGGKVIWVKSGISFASLSDDVYLLNPAERGDYDTLLKTLRAQNRFPKRIVHAWTVGSFDPGEDNLNHGFYSLLYLAQALGEQIDIPDVNIFVLSNNMQEVTGEEMIDPKKATLLGPVKVIPQEFPNLQIRSIDILLPNYGSAQEERLIDQLIAEFSAKAKDRVIALRNRHRWVPCFEPVRLDRSAAASRLRNQGVYLITGGLGGLGLAFAEHLAKTAQARLILTSRSPFPAKSDWNQWLAEHNESDGISRKIRKIQSLEAADAVVLIERADVADLSRMRKVIADAERLFGRIHGVIHAAGIASGGMIQRKTREMVERVFWPKVRGARVLLELFHGVPLDFLALFSSVSSVLEEFGQVDYCAANAFLDACAGAHPQVVCINWDTWREVGMAVDAPVPKELQAARAERLEAGILSQEGVDAFERILSARFSRVLVSTRDFESRMRSAVPSDESVTATLEPMQITHHRPELSEAYVPPENAIEEKLAAIWQELLGMDQVGTHDDFFMLGGHSLLATQALSRIHQVFNLRLPLNLFFEAPTIALLSERILARQLEQLDSEELDQILSEADALSDDPANRSASGEVE